MCVCVCVCVKVLFFQELIFNIRILIPTFSFSILQICAYEIVKVYYSK